MAITKPVKPNITVPANFGGIKTVWSDDKVNNGFEENVQQVLAGDNLNYLIDLINQYTTYLNKVADFINATPLNKVVYVNNNNQLDYNDAIPSQTGNRGKILTTDGTNVSWKSISSNAIGQIISMQCTKDYVPMGCLPCDGQQYEKAQFPDLWNNYLNAETPLLLTCTYSEYQQDITTYGQCIKFAIDTTKEIFKVPTIKNGSYITQALSDTELGKSYNESLPNIRAKSYSTSTGTTGNVDNNVVISGAYEIDTLITTRNIQSGTLSTSKALAINASLSSSTYQDNAKVQGDNVRLRFFVVVANGEINQSQMDWSAWASSLQGKTNTDLSNLTTIGKEELTILSSPSNRRIELSVQNNSTNTFIAPASGYYSCFCNAHKDGSAIDCANTTTNIQNTSSRSSGSTGPFLGSSIKCSKGDRVNITLFNNGSNIHAYFVYDKGN